jgi:hypothetical protein
MEISESSLSSCEQTSLCRDNYINFALLSILAFSLMSCVPQKDTIDLARMRKVHSLMFDAISLSYSVDYKLINESISNARVMCNKTNVSDLIEKRIPVNCFILSSQIIDNFSILKVPVNLTQCIKISTEFKNIDNYIKNVINVKFEKNKYVNNEYDSRLLSEIFYSSCADDTWSVSFKNIDVTSGTK